jgi:hypothetical protein
VLIGATMSSKVLHNYSGMLAGNHIMRIFPTRTMRLGDSMCKLPPDWGKGRGDGTDDVRLEYCRTLPGGKYGHVIPFLSSKGNGSDEFVRAMRDYLERMPPWFKMVYYCDWHEPEQFYRPGKEGFEPEDYQEHQRKLWRMITRDLSEGVRKRLRFGPVLTKQYTESNGGNDYGKYDPGPAVGDFFGVDAYVSSNIGNDVVTYDTLPRAREFLAHIRRYPDGVHDARPRLFPELGLIGMPADIDGKWRADWIREVHAELKSWRPGAPGWTQPWSFAGWIWWNESGANTGEVPQIGPARDFPLHLRSLPLGMWRDGQARAHWRSRSVPIEPIPAAPVKAYNAIWQAENRGQGEGPGFDPGSAPEIEPYPTTGIGSYLVGATMRWEEIPAYAPTLAANRLFWVFPDEDGLPPAWTDSRFEYARTTGATLIVSSKLDGDYDRFPAMVDWLTEMPDWVTSLYVTDRHSPETEFPGDPASYLANFETWWYQVIMALPDVVRARLKAGPILTQRYIEATGGGDGDYSVWDPMRVGIKTDFFAVDAFARSWKRGYAPLAADAYPDPAAFLAGLKAYRYDETDDRERLIPALGAIGIPADPTGAMRAAWITGVFRELDSWSEAERGWRFAGVSWWQREGRPDELSLDPIGVRRCYYLDSYQPDAGEPRPLPGPIPAPLAAYNQAAAVHPGEFTDGAEPRRPALAGAAPS